MKSFIRNFLYTALIAQICTTVVKAKVNMPGSPNSGPLSGSTQPDSGWISLFNGKTLDGWQVKCLPEDRNKTYWKVEDGTITCNSLDDKSHNYVWLVSEAEYKNFELRLSFMAYRDSPGNSGVQIRSRFDDSPGAPNGGWMDGPQVDIQPPDPFRTGLIYDETREEKRWIHPDLKDWQIDSSYAAPEWSFKYAEEGWNELTIFCNGTYIRTILNGDVITDWNGKGVLDNQAHKSHHIDKSGHIALQLHARDALKINFKNIRIRKL